MTIDTLRETAEIGNPMILEADVEGVLRDQEGHASNISRQLIDDVANVIEGEVVVSENVGNSRVVRNSAFGDYNKTEQLYANRYAIRTPPF